MGVSVTVDTSKLDAAISRVMRETGKSLETVTRQAGIYFAQSAALATPPDEGRRRFTKRSQFRPVIAMTDKAGRTRYKVPYRTAKKRGRKWFDSRGEAKEFSRVKWRGIARAGWWAALLAFGQSVAAQPGTTEVKTSVNRWGGGAFFREALAPAVTIRNAAPIVKGSFSAMIANKALGKTRRRLIQAMTADLNKLPGKFNR